MFQNDQADGRSVNAVRYALLLAMPMILGALALWLFAMLVERAVIRDAERQSLAWAEFAAQQLDNVEEMASGQPASPEDLDTISLLENFGNVFRFKLFDNSGKLGFVSDDPSRNGPSLGEHNPDASSVVNSMNPYTHVNDGTQKPDRPDLYSETYLPVIKDGKMVAIVETYLDQTATRAEIRQDYLVFGLVIVGILALAIMGPGIAFAMVFRRLREKNAQLKIETERAVRADRTKTEFLANVSHELRTPMNGVMGIGQLLSRTDLDAKQERFVEQLMKSANRQLRLIEDLLLFSQVEAGMRRLEIAPFEPRRVLDEVAALTESGLGDKPVSLVTRSELDETVRVAGDSGAYAQVLTNLVGNAVKFTDEGEVEISLALDRSRVPLRIVTTVRDTGSGMSETDMTRIFDRFVQADGSKERKHGGTGLGLAITKELVELMKGEITVDSQPGAGATFTVAIPVVLAEPVSRPIAEDDDLNMMIITELVSALGFDIVAAVNGEEAVVAALEHKPCIILMDISMPKLNGVEATKKILEALGAKAPPIIAVTANATIEQRAECAAAGFHSFETKPVNFVSLEATIEKAVRLSGHAA